MKLDLNYANSAPNGFPRYAWRAGLPALASEDAEYAPYNDRNIYADRIDRLGWLGKEKDLESGLGDHGVRKYDAGSGRFLSVDPLWEKYLSWTPYQYSMNDPINKLDIDGRDVIVAFSGGNFFGQQDHSTAGKIVDNINQYAKDNNISDVNAISFATQAIPNDLRINDALSYINRNLSPGEKLIIYGYSAGGVSAHKLSEALNEKNIKVDLLITVDAAFSIGSGNLNRQIPANVRINSNYFQTTPSFPLFSRGRKNKAVSKNTLINNFQEDSPHSDIDEDTQDRVEKEIKGEITK